MESWNTSPSFTHFPIPCEWQECLCHPSIQHCILLLEDYLQKECHTYVPDINIYPPPYLVYHALELCSPAKTRVVILGQDPYHQPGQAMGLSFSVPRSVKLPPSLRNIYTEIDRDLETNLIQSKAEGELSSWARQGVLLLNTSLTVLQNNPNRHCHFWKDITDYLIRYIAQHHSNIIFMLWGNHARSKKKIIEESENSHFILECAHPSPYSVSRFRGCSHFSKCNKFLRDIDQVPIQWDSVCDSSLVVSPDPSCAVRFFTTTKKIEEHDQSLQQQQL